MGIFTLMLVQVLIPISTFMMVERFVLVDEILLREQFSIQQASPSMMAHSMGMVLVLLPSIQRTFLREQQVLTSREMPQQPV
jgi:hypothetical protein